MRQRHLTPSLQQTAHAAFSVLTALAAAAAAAAAACDCDLAPPLAVAAAAALAAEQGGHPHACWISACLVEGVRAGHSVLVSISTHVGMLIDTAATNSGTCRAAWACSLCSSCFGGAAHDPAAFGLALSVHARCYASWAKDGWQARDDATVTGPQWLTGDCDRTTMVDRP
eukprot:1137139-Pelagomonas_calceolata.AAC.5